MEFIYFKSTSCPQCSLLDSEILSLREELFFENSGCDFLTCVHPDDEDLFRKYGIMSVPTCLVVDAKKVEIERFYGMKTKEFIKNFVSEI